MVSLVNAYHTGIDLITEEEWMKATIEFVRGYEKAREKYRVAVTECNQMRRRENHG